jgi:hypothetical protein
VSLCREGEVSRNCTSEPMGKNANRYSFARLPVRSMGAGAPAYPNIAAEGVRIEPPHSRCRFSPLPCPMRTTTTPWTVTKKSGERSGSGEKGCHAAGPRPVRRRRMWAASDGLVEAATDLLSCLVSRSLFSLWISLEDPIGEGAQWAPAALGW